MTASACAILSAKAVWAAAKDAEVAEKVRTASIMARKSRGEIEIDCMGGAEVLGPAESEVGDAGSGIVTNGVVETGI